MSIYEESFGDEYFKEGDYSDIEQLRAISQKAFMSFCARFQLMPHYIERGLAENLWEELLARPLDSIHAELVASAEQHFDPETEKGFVFTFSRFVLLLVVVNRIYLLKLFKNERELSLSPEESGLLLLNHIQNSPGFKASQQKKSVSHSRNGLCSRDGYRDLARASIYSGFSRSHTSKHLQPQPQFFDPPRDSEQAGPVSASQEGGLGLQSLRGTGQSSKRLRSLSKNLRLADHLHYRDEAIGVFEKYGEPLGSLFALYAGMGEPLNASKMKSMKLHRLFRDAGLLQQQSNSISSRPLVGRSRGASSQTSARKLPAKKSLESVQLTPVDLDLFFVQLTG